LTISLRADDEKEAEEILALVRKRLKDVEVEPLDRVTVEIEPEGEHTEFEEF
jgi:hypothetical protein